MMEKKTQRHQQLDRPRLRDRPEGLCVNGPSPAGPISRSLLLLTQRRHRAPPPRGEPGPW
ncbi:hypothetical protein M885DRAFT_527834 [Pelagophyceae sp. CCMP2097]|nr:hypothetical protein M885DRAFT_527834 [Pelagophyceae sp. CCMP2097]